MFRSFAVYHRYYKKCCSSIRLFYTFAGELWKMTVFWRIRRSYARAGKIIVKYFVSTGPIIFPWQNSILRRIISLYLKSIARFSYKIRIKIFFARGALLFSYRANPRHRNISRLLYIIIIHFSSKLEFDASAPRSLMSLDNARRPVANFVSGIRESARLTRYGGSQREYAIKEMPEKNLGTLRSRGPLPHVKRRVQISGAVVDASVNLFFAPRGSFAGSLEDLSGPLRLPSENLSIAQMARARQKPREYRV